MKNSIFIGSIFTILAYMSYSFMDTTTKYNLTHHKIHSQVFYLYVNITIFIFLSFYLLKNNTKLNDLKVKHPLGLFFRIITGIMCLNMGFIILPYIQLDMYYAIVFFSPIIACILSIIFLKEKLTYTKLFIILLGFIGVTIVTNPFNSLYSHKIIILPLLGAFVVSFGNGLIWILSRKFLTKDKPSIILFYQFLAATLWCIIVLLIKYHKIEIIPLVQLKFVFLVALFSFLGYWFYTKAVQLSPLQYILPLEYTLIIFGSILGIIVFKQYPSINTIFGSAIIVLASVYMLAYNKKQN